MDINIIILILAILGSLILTFYLLTYSKKRKKISDLVKENDLFEELEREKKLKALSKKNEYPYIPKKVLENDEVEIYYKLVETFPYQNVLVKVPFAVFLDVKEGFNRQILKNKTKKYIADFILCKRDFSVVLVINTSKNITEKSLEEKEKILENAKIPMFIWDLENPPTDEELKEILKSSNR